MESERSTTDSGRGRSPGPPDRDREATLLVQIEGLREYLHLLARRKITPELAAKVAPSDLVQETLCIAVRKVAGFRGEGQTPARLRGWLERILDHQVANARHRYMGTGKRRLDREVPADDPADPGSSPSKAACRHERQEALRLAMGRLPEHYRRVLLWRYWDRLGYEAIARNLGITTEAARKVGARALIALRTQIGPDNAPF